MAEPSKKRKGDVDNLKDIKLRITADIKDANKSLKSLQEKVEKLGDLSDQGSTKQRGFLSSKQVRMYKSILQEMETEYTRHQKRLQQIEEEYSKRKTNAQNTANSRKLDLNSAIQRGVVDGDPLTQGVYNHYKAKYDQANSKASSIENDPKILGQMEGLRDAIGDLEDQIKRVQPSVDSINKMHVQDTSAKDLTNGVLHLLGSVGAVTSLGALTNYVGTGSKMLRTDEYSSAIIGQKIGYEKGNDADIRNNTAKLGEQNQYNVSETLQTQGKLLKGGYNSLSDLNKDTSTAQQFGRAYGVDPNELGESGALLKRMGTLKDGEMQRFANMIAGSISKTKMNGREEEVLRSTTTLLSQVGNKLVGLSDNEMYNVSGLQTTMGEAIPELRGEQGAQLLSTMDSSIKGGDSSFDILMGKGTKYTGIEGQYQLDLQKEQGLANPKNLQDFFQGIDRTGASDTEKAYMSTKIGLTLNEEKALRESGLIEKFKKGDFNVTDKEKEQLQKAGADNLVKQMDSWNTTESKKQADNDSQMFNLQEDTSKPYDRSAKGILGLWNKLPNSVQGTAIWGAGLGGGLFGKSLIRKYGSKLVDWGTKTFTKDVGSGGGFKGFKGMFSKTASEGAEGGMSFMGKVGKAASSLGDDAMGAGSKLLGGLGKYGSKAVSALGKVGKAIPIAGFALDVGIDRLQKPESSWGRSIFKGLGGLVGGAAGIAGAGALGLGTGGVGLAATGALTVGGSMAGNNAGDSLYSWMFGDGDISPTNTTSATGTSTTETEPVAQEQSQAVVNKTSSNVTTMKVDTLDVNGTSLDRLIDTKSIKTTGKTDGSGSGSYSGFKNVESAINSVGTDHNINITISGKIDGMNNKNQSEIKDSITGFWSRLLGKDDKDSVNLAYSFKNN